MPRIYGFKIHSESPYHKQRLLKSEEELERVSANEQQIAQEVNNSRSMGGTQASLNQSSFPNNATVPQSQSQEVGGGMMTGTNPNDSNSVPYNASNVTYR